MEIWVAIELCIESWDQTPIELAGHEFESITIKSPKFLTP